MQRKEKLAFFAACQHICESIARIFRSLFLLYIIVAVVVVVALLSNLVNHRHSRFQFG